LDIDPLGKPDVLCDARELWKLPARQYDAIYCSHNLEHYYAHDVVKVLKGFRMVLKKGGFAYIMVPDLLEVMKAVVEKGKGLEDVLYETHGESFLVRDVIYGYQRQIERSEKDFYAHKTGFTEESLTKTLMKNGFPYVFSDVDNFEIMALAFMDNPTPWQTELLEIS
jgi:ubiquinone/menaquinone biosynthesis C-methylase UbiE